MPLVWAADGLIVVSRAMHEEYAVPGGQYSVPADNIQAVWPAVLPAAAGEGEAT
jgi:hypothetical protein